MPSVKPSLPTLGLALAMAFSGAGPAHAGRATCTASLSSAGLLTLESVTATGASSSYLTKFSVNKTIPLGFSQDSASLSSSACYDSASLGSTFLTIPDILVGADYYNASLKLVDSASKLYSLDLAGKNPRLVPDAGIRVSKASNPFATVDANGLATLGYMDASSGKTTFQTASDGLTFSGATVLSYSNRLGDSRKTLMPDGKTWRLYEYDLTAKKMLSYSSTDGNSFTLEGGSRYAPASADNDSIGVYDTYVATDGSVIMTYVGDLLGKNNLRMARSTDNGVTFTFLKGNVLGDDDAGGGGSTFIDNKTMLLADGRRRMVTMRANEIHSFISSDGISYTREPGVRLRPADFAAAGVTIYSLNDPVMVATPQGGYRVYVAASTSEVADETAGNANWVIVSALWSGKETAFTPTQISAPSAVTLANVNTTTVGSNSFSSASKLALSWTRPSATVDHYLITAVDASAGTVRTFTASGGTNSSASLTGLKSATTYSVQVTACGDAACANHASAAAATGKTSEEYWQLQGTSGATSDAVSRVTSDSQTLNYAVAYGDWAGADLKGKIRYYYNPNVAAEKGSKSALTKSVASATASTLTSFDTLSGYGLLLGSGSTQSTGIGSSIGQAIAIPYNGKMRLMVEAEGVDKQNRIYQIDSADGYTGVDFNPGSATSCKVSSGDMATGGACAMSIALGLTADGFSSSGVKAFRQMKLLYPTQTSWVWDGATNTPMIVTIDLQSSTTCAKYKFTQGWALWDGSKWALQYDSDGKCPKLFDGMQAPAPVHLGDGRYKMYYSNNQTLITTQTFDFDNKPVKVLYGTAAAASGIIAFDDFEATSKARDVNFLWPDGSLMALYTSPATGAETKLDDYTMLAPTGDLDVQVMYTNFSGGSKGPFTAAAILLNP